MKKMFLTVFAATALLFSVQNASAQEATPQPVVTEEAAEQHADWREIEIQELPAEVQQAVERDFTGSVISEAYVKEKEGEQKFKLKVKAEDGTEEELYADAQGNWIEKDKKDK